TSKRPLINGARWPPRPIGARPIVRAGNARCAGPGVACAVPPLIPYHRRKAERICRARARRSTACGRTRVIGGSRASKPWPPRMALMSASPAEATWYSSIPPLRRRCQFRRVGRSSRFMSVALLRLSRRCERAMSDTEYRFTVRPLTEDEGGGYLIEFPDWPGCVSDGETIEEALANGEDAKRCWIAAMNEAGRPIPPPSVEPAEGYSGKWQLRAPKSLHRRLAERAKREGVSLNTLAVPLLAEGLGERAAHER